MAKNERPKGGALKKGVSGLFSRYRGRGAPPTGALGVRPGSLAAQLVQLKAQNLKIAITGPKMT